VKYTHPSNVKILLVPRDLTRLTFQFVASKHLVRAETFPPSFLATAASPLFSRNDNDIFLALRLIRHKPPRTKRKALETKTRRVNVARGSATLPRGIRARHGGLKATQQTRPAHLFLGRCVRKHGGEELRRRLNDFELARRRSSCAKTETCRRAAYGGKIERGARGGRADSARTDGNGLRMRHHLGSHYGRGDFFAGGD
jgi:hypothetical protein